MRQKEEKMRIMIAAGGTGGHVYPALAVAEALQAESATTREAIELYFVGSTGGFERPLVDEAVKESGLRFAAYDEVRAGPLHGVPLWQVPISLFNLIVGFIQSLMLTL